MGVSSLKRYFSISISFLILLGGIPTMANASDIRFVDIARITWDGAPAPTATVIQIASAITNEVSTNWKSFTSTLGDSRDRAINFTHGQTLENPVKWEILLDL
jgi:hypothetical protein